MSSKFLENYIKFFGKTFNRLTVLPVIGEGKNKYYYYCKCECGKEKWIRKGHLIDGNTKSCGCYLKEIAKELQLQIAKNNFVDLSNQKFERLTVISIAGKDINNNYLYNCECICGNKTIVIGDNLKRGITKSCGCIQSEMMKKRNKDYRISKGKDPDIFMNNISLTERQKFHDSEIYQKVLKRDNYKCQFCPDIYENLEIHHILSWSKYPELRYELTNLITLCKICHIPIIHNGNIKIEPHEQTTKMLQNIIKTHELVII